MIDIEKLGLEIERLSSSLELHFQEAIRTLEMSKDRDTDLDYILVTIAPQIISFKNTCMDSVRRSQLNKSQTTIGALNHLHGWYCQIVGDISNHLHYMHR